jgi:hypothetical protein
MPSSSRGLRSEPMYRRGRWLDRFSRLRLTTQIQMPLASWRSSMQFPALGSALRRDSLRRGVEKALRSTSWAEWRKSSSARERSGTWMRRSRGSDFRLIPGTGSSARCGCLKRSPLRGRSWVEGGHRLDSSSALGRGWSCFIATTTPPIGSSSWRSLTVVQRCPPGPLAARKDPRHRRDRSGCRSVVTGVRQLTKVSGLGARFDYRAHAASAGSCR